MKRASMFAVGVLTAGLMAGGGALMAEKGNVDELRLGTALDESGAVDAETNDDQFPPDVPIYVSVQVDKAVRGTELKLSVMDRETSESVWNQKQSVAGGHEIAHFVLTDLRPGKYRAEVKLGSDWVAGREFTIEEP